MTSPDDHRIGDIAARQHGVVTRGQLLAAGLTPGAVRTRVRSGRLTRMYGGVYLLGELQGVVEPLRAQEMAAVLASGPGALVSRWSAARLWNLEPQASTGEGRPPVDVLFPPGRTPARLRGIRAQRATLLASGDVARVEGIPTTSPPRTLLDLAAVASSRELERIVARAERDGLVDRRALAALGGRVRGRRGALALRGILHLEGGPRFTRSEAESVLLELVRSGGIEEPESNVRVAGFELDFFWRRERVAAEVDGFAHHASRARFESDRRRDAVLLARGVQTMRITWRQLTREREQTLVRLAQALAQRATASER